MRSKAPGVSGIFTWGLYVMNKLSNRSGFFTGSSLFFLLTCFRTKYLTAPSEKLVGFSCTVLSHRLYGHPSCSGRLYFCNRRHCLLKRKTKPHLLTRTKLYLNYFLQMFQGRGPWFGWNSDPTVFALQTIVTIGCMLPAAEKKSSDTSDESFRHQGML